MANYLTQDDVNNYGSDLVDFAQRAAVHALSPHIQNLEAQNAELQRGLAREARARLDHAVERAIPNFREIDRDSGWHRWLLGSDALSGQVRQQLLNAAIRDSDAGRVISFFKGYLREAGAGGTHAASRTRSATSAPSGRIYTPADIARLYSQHRKGAYNEAAWRAQEQDIFRAQREGRIAAQPYLTK